MCVNYYDVNQATWFPLEILRDVLKRKMIRCIEANVSVTEVTGEEEAIFKWATLKVTKYTERVFIIGLQRPEDELMMKPLLRK